MKNVEDVLCPKVSNVQLRVNFLGKNKQAHPSNQCANLIHDRIVYVCTKELLQNKFMIHYQ